ncbi:hypothetical protein H671_3g8917 [Cricetulus griseus]|uniref:Uncharacterized protein n=1 Tax=Cricetulus griseus TaxID=10029 RepID=A0A061IF16_CRIGR|nr:hypothetical protein H671_3g8917 [Cricetulus griseus]
MHNSCASTKWNRSQNRNRQHRPVYNHRQMQHSKQAQNIPDHQQQKRHKFNGPSSVNTQYDSWNTSMGLIQTQGTWVSVRKPQKSMGPPVEGCVLVNVSIAVMKTTSKKTPKVGVIDFVPSHPSPKGAMNSSHPSPKGAMRTQKQLLIIEESQYRNSNRAGNWREEQMQRPCYLLASSTWLAQPAFLQNSGPPAQEGPTHNESGLPPSIIN